ncbi:hypothetical protein BDZ94DRAFT_1231135 [Collybia nuda]|uniref:Uncharacterized protein n=1 Tax=Collybia nuda TaxID=64659 RepID=A0A9P5YKW5_9AGAR|nr:hypothetical protein BDZ94DRAFT_1231135 [Collybia nuda]
MSTVLEIAYARQYTNYATGEISSGTLRSLAQHEKVVASVIVFVFDYFVTLELETCSKLGSATLWMATLGILVSEDSSSYYDLKVILLLRTYALWGNNLITLIFLTTLLGCIYISDAVIIKSPSPAISGCFEVDASKISFLAIVLLLLNESGKS